MNRILLILLGITTAAGFCFGENPPDTVWTVQYGGMSNNADYAKGIAVDSAGMVYVAGYHISMNPYFQICIVKYYGATGDTAWTRIVNVPNNISINCCAVDNNGRLFVAGSIIQFSNMNYYVICFDVSNGDTIWSRCYNSPYNWGDRANACACDDSGHLYVTGTVSTDGVNSDYLTIKYDASGGDTIWTRSYHIGNDKAYGCSASLDGSITVTGSTRTVKYTSLGDTVWTRRIGGNACATDSMGNVYVTGDSGTCKYTSAGDSLWHKPSVGKGCTFANGKVFITGTTGPAGDEDFLTLSLDAASGDSVWANRYNGAADSSDIGWACAADNAGHIYATGYSFHPYQYDILTIGYDAASGDTLWTRYHNIPYGPVSSYGWGCAVDTMRNEIYISGFAASPNDYRNGDFTTLHCVTGNGQIVGMTYYDDQAHQTNWGYPCVMDPLHDAYFIAGQSSPDYGAHVEWAIVRYDASTWDTVWTRQYTISGTQDLIFNCKTDYAGHALYICGYLGDSINTTLFDGCVLKLDTQNGDSLWSRRYHCPNDSATYYFSMASSTSNDSIFVCGGTNGGAHRVCLFEALDSETGDTIWSRTYDVGGSSGITGCALSMTDDTLFAVGYCGNDGLLIAANTANGDTIYSQRYHSDSSAFYSCHLDRSGRYLYAVGCDWHTPDTMKGLVVKYSLSTGDTVWSKRIMLENHGTTELYSCDLDQQGDLYLAGRAYSDDQHDYKCIAIKLNTSLSIVAGSPYTISVPLLLSQNRPNPFRAWTSIAYQLPAAIPVSLCIYNIAGQRVRTLASGVQTAGGHQVKWDGADEGGTRVSSGIYFYRLSIPGSDVTGKMTLLR